MPLIGMAYSYYYMDSEPNVNRKIQKFGFIFRFFGLQGENYSNIWIARANYPNIWIEIWKVRAKRALHPAQHAIPTARRVGKIETESSSSRSRYTRRQVGRADEMGLYPAQHAIPFARRGEWGRWRLYPAHRAVCICIDDTGCEARREGEALSRVIPSAANAGSGGAGWASGPFRGWVRRRESGFRRRFYRRFRSTRSRFLRRARPARRPFPEASA